MERQRLEWHLENWVSWMHAPGVNLGYPRQSMMIVSGTDSCVDAFEVMCEESDAIAAKTLDAMIDSLRPPQKVAVNHHWLRVQHHYPTQAMDYEDAIESLMRQADKRGLV